MNKIFTPLFVALLGLAACSPSANRIFNRKTPIEKYADKLEDEGLHQTPEGRQWLAIGQQVLQAPVAVDLPYRHTGQFPQVQPQAVGLQFSARQGQRLSFTLEKEDPASFVLYAELYRRHVDGRFSLLQSPDTNVAAFVFDVPETGDYILKLQPQLRRVGRYQLAIGTGPSLAFPVADKKAAVGSFWGADRDGGKRSHEGVDIFAPKRTPAVAAAAGRVVGVREGGLGGKTVWLRPDGKDYTLYYAHLDEQLVQEGQEVKEGEVLGLVGNTGNAITTPPHLHFGVYGMGGAVDPFPFIDRAQKTAVAVPAKKLEGELRLIKTLIHAGRTLAKNTLLQPLAVQATGYLAALPDGGLVEVRFAAVQAAGQPLKKTKAATAVALYKTPETAATPSGTLPAGTTVNVLGYFNTYAFVRTATTEGWVQEGLL